jgi:hypothetical protein
MAAGAVPMVSDAEEVGPCPDPYPEEDSGHMTAKFVQPSTGRRYISPPEPHDSAESASYLIKWHAARRADHACCCIARPAVVVLMPPTAGRPHETDLLLCGHHYRISKQALAAVGATVLDPMVFRPLPSRSGHRCRCDFLPALASAAKGRWSLAAPSGERDS